MSAETRPEPLVPAHVDLRGYEFMPLYGDVLRRSSFNGAASDAEFRAALNLWWSAWWETPAASVPNNEREIARLAGVTDMRRWRYVRARVMEKWVLCADNRLYNPYLSVLAMDAFAKRIAASIKGGKGAEKRWGINGKAHSTSTATANATAISTDSPGNGTGNSNRSKGNTPPTPPSGRSTSTPATPAHSTAKAEQVKAENAIARAHAAPPPGDVLPSEFFKQSTKPKPQPESFEDPFA